MGAKENSLANLIPITKENAKEMGRKAGIQSGIAKRKKKAFKELAKEMLELSLKDGKLDKITSMDVKGKNLTVKEVMLIAQFKKALKGDENALRMIMALSDEIVDNNPQPQVNNENKETDTFINALNGVGEKVWNDEKES